MKTVWRFKFNPNAAVSEIELPVGASNLMAAPSGVYALVETDAPKEKLTVVRVRVGDAVPKADDSRVLWVAGSAESGGFAIVLLRNPDAGDLVKLQEAAAAKNSLAKGPPPKGSGAKHGTDEEDGEDED